MLSIPSFKNCITYEDCGLLIEKLIEKYKDENTFLYPLFKKAGAFKFDTDGWGEISFVEMERERLEEIYWNNSTCVLNRDFSKNETEEEFREREAEEERVMKDIRSKVNDIINSQLEK